MGLIKFIKKIPRVYLIVLALVLLGGFLVFTRGNQDQKIELVEVRKGDIRLVVSTVGTSAAKDQVDLKFKSSGKLASVNVKVGDTVTKNQVLSTLDTQDLEISLQQSQNTLRDKQATVDKALDDIHLFQYGQGGFAKVGTFHETMTQRQNRTQTEVGRDNAFDQVKAAQRAFQDAVIISPLLGVVTKVGPKPGQFVSSTEVIVQVSDQSEFYFEAEVDETDVGKVTVGQPASVTLDAYPNQTFPAEVTEITPQTKITSAGATVVVVKINLGQPKIAFIKGLNGQSLITVQEKKEVLMIPQEAVRDDQTVLILIPSGFEAVRIKTGLSSESEVEITEGLREGQKVVGNPAAFPEPGQNLLNRVGRILRGRR